MPVVRGAPVDRGEDATGRWSRERLGDAGGLTQFGAVIETLAPGGRSSDPHWHEGEDEFVHLLSGRLVLLEDGARTPMAPGDSATFRAGDPVHHCLLNEGPDEARFLVVGTRAARDVVRYADGRVRTVEGGRGVLRDAEGREIEG